MRAAALLALVASCVPVQRRDYAISGAALVATAIDWRQTINITRQCSEVNPLLGRCGEHISPHLYFPLSVLAVGAVALAIPSGPWRTAFLGATAGAEASTVLGNFASGWSW